MSHHGSYRETNATHRQSPIQELVGNARVVFVWTVVSRITGFARVAVLAAVLGPTFFGNLFQTILFLPYFVCQFLLVWLIPSLLTPFLVRHLEDENPDAAKRLACSAFGLALTAFSAMAVLTIIAAPWIVALVTLAVDDPIIRGEQVRLGWPLIAILAPQIPLYALAVIGLAVQHAHSRFALATAAQTIDNIVFVAFLMLTAALYGVGQELSAVTIGQVVLLGVGSTAGVLIHAIVQWWGARMVGMTLTPRGHWRDPDLWQPLKMALPSSGNAGLSSFGVLALMTVAGSVPGGTVAFQLAYNLFNLPVALVARPVATAQLPLMARKSTGNHDPVAGPAGMFSQAMGLALFVAWPAAAVFILLPDHVATLVTFGGMRAEAGMILVIAAIVSIGWAIPGETALVVATSAAYSRHDAVTPLYANAMRTTVICLGLIPILALTDGWWRLAALGFVYSGATLAAGYSLYRWQSPEPSGASALDTRHDIGCAVLAGLAGLAIALALPMARDMMPVIVAFSALGMTAFSYVGCQHLLGSGRLSLLAGLMRAGTGKQAATQPGRPLQRDRGRP